MKLVSFIIFSNECEQRDISVFYDVVFEFNKKAVMVIGLELLLL